MTTARQPLEVDVISDVVCPWCFIGKRRLEKALAASGVPVRVRWRPYQLDPTIPPEGRDRGAYLEAKFGSADRIRQIHENVSATGRSEGISFAFEDIKVSPNTLDAHRLLRWSGQSGKQEEAVEALFRAYFVEGQDIGDQRVLAKIAASVGLDRDQIARRLASDEDRDSVRAEIDAAQTMGVTGVPTFILANRYALVGAQPAEKLADAFRQVAEQLNSETAA